MLIVILKKDVRDFQKKAFNPYKNLSRLDFLRRENVTIRFLRSKTKLNFFRKIASILDTTPFKNEKTLGEIAIPVFAR